MMKNWLIKIASNIVIEMSQYKRIIRQELKKIINSSLERSEYLKNLVINKQNIISELSNVNYPNSNLIIQSLLNNDTKTLEQELYNNYLKWTLDMSPSDNVYMQARSIYKQLNDFIDQQDDTYVYTNEAMEDDYQKLLNKTYDNMSKIYNNIQQSIKNIKNWNGSEVKIIPLIPTSSIDFQDDYLQPSVDASIELKSANSLDMPSFTYFTNEGQPPQIEDVLEAGDEDFFTDNKVQQDYFSLVRELQHPGTSSKPGKILTLYTARPIKDRQIYENATQIPSNIFLTSSFSSARGIARDFAENGISRDVWKVRIDSNYLIQTLEGTEKQYQVVGGDFIPVKSMTLFDLGEKL